MARGTEPGAGWRERANGAKIGADPQPENDPMPPLRPIAAPLLLLLAAACAPPSPAPGAAPAGRPLQLFLLAGQSNMAGRGMIEPEDSVVNPRVWMFTRDERWQPAVEPMHFDKPIAGVGPGRSFGLALAEAEEGIEIGLIPTAVGGSAITSWVPGGVHAETGAHPYDDAIRRARAAMRDGELKAILWHQGESDANARAAPEYEARLRALIERFRSDLGDPTLPVLVGQIGRFEGKPWDEPHLQVDAAHRAVAVRLPNVVYVSAEGLAHRGDTLHFSAKAARAFGRRYAEAYLALTGRGARR
jgi:hypothetical protein